MNMKELSFFSHYGPGGRNCTCCGPSPKTRKKHDRTAKRRANDYLKRTIKKELKEIEINA